MAYCTLADVRAEGVSLDIPDGRITSTIAQATAYIDAMTGQWFESRPRVFLMDCAGGIILPLPLAPISITTVTVAGAVWPATDYVMDNDAGNPRLVATKAGVGRWPYGQAVISVDGAWGVLEGGQTPALIRIAALRLVVRELPLATDLDGQEARKRPRILMENMHVFSYSLSRLHSAAEFTGDHEIDLILTRYARPLRSGVT